MQDETFNLDLASTMDDNNNKKITNEVTESTNRIERSAINPTNTIYKKMASLGKD
jgi:hypothetical protein